MSQCRIPGPTGVFTQPIDDGTSVLRWSFSPGPVGSTGNSVGAMSLEDRFTSVLRLTLPKLPADIQEEFATMLSPAALLTVVGVLVIWAGSHYVGIGFIVDAVMLVGGVIFLGWQVWSAASDFLACLELTYSATSEQDLDRAATHLSNFIAVVGVTAFIAMLTKGAGKRINTSAIRAKVISKIATADDAGMAATHFQAILRVAMNPKQPRIVLFRKTNPQSVKYIERGFPPKPKEIKTKTNADSGIVTADDLGEATKVRETIDLSGADWPVETGQVIDPIAKKPLVGDYDLFDVFDPKVLAGTKPPNQGNLVLASSDGKFVDDFTNPWVNRAIDDLNAAIGSRRVMHGTHGAFDSIDNLKADEMVTAFFPDGRAVTMNKEALREFYQRIGRSTLDLYQFLPK